MYAVLPSADAITSCGSGPEGTRAITFSDTGSTIDIVKSVFARTSSAPDERGVVCADASAAHATAASATAVKAFMRIACTSMERARLSFDGDDVRVLRANLVVGGILVEMPHGIPAQQREVGAVRELVPQHFEADRRRVHACLPQDVDHLAVGAHDASVRDPAEELRHAVVEPFAVRHAVDHERREQL